MKLLVINEYVINHKTQALLHYRTSTMGHFTLVKEEYKTFLVKLTPISIMNATQLYYNTENVKYKRLEKEYKMIVFQIAPYLSIGLCPTTDNVWILEEHMNRLEKTNDGRMIIYLLNGNVITLYPTKKGSNLSPCLASDEQNKDLESHSYEALHSKQVLKEEETIKYIIQFKGKRKKK